MILLLALSLAATDTVTSSFQVLDPGLAERVVAMERQSPSFGEAMAEVRASGIPVVMGTPEQIRRHLPDLRLDMPKGGGVVAWFSGGDEVYSAVVVIDAPRLTQAYLRAYPHATNIDLYVDRVLVHELFGHLAPVVISGRMSERCLDPQGRSREAFEASCAIQRENIVRQELNMGLASR